MRVKNRDRKGAITYSLFQIWGVVPSEYPIDGTLHQWRIVDIGVQHCSRLLIFRFRRQQAIRR